MFGMRYDENDIPIVYVDGVCTDRGKPNAKGGIGVFFNNKNTYNVSSPVKGDKPSCAEAELQAAARGLEQAARMGLHRVVIATDSQFVIDMATSTIPQYKKNGWRTYKDETPDYYETLKRLDKAVQMMMVVKWKHLQKPTSISEHVAAYKMAYNGAKDYKKDDKRLTQNKN